MTSAESSPPCPCHPEYPLTVSVDVTEEQGRLLDELQEQFELTYNEFTMEPIETWAEVIELILSRELPIWRDKAFNGQLKELLP